MIGLGQNIFYGTGLAPCVLVFRDSKTHRQKVLFIDTAKELKTGRAQNELLPNTSTTSTPGPKKIDGMNSTSSTLQSLWRYLDSRRGDEHTNPWKALLALARGQIPGELTPDVIEAVIGRAASRRAGEFVTPPMLSRFMADLASITKPDFVLDPTCGSGLMLQQVIAAHKPGVAEGIDLNHDNCEIASELLIDQAAITHGNALDATLKLQEAYDLIIADPPLGEHVHPGSFRPRLKTYAYAIWRNTLPYGLAISLPPKGVLAIVMSPVTLQHQPFVDATHTAGCRIRASLHVPSGRDSTQESLLRSWSSTMAHNKTSLSANCLMIQSTANGFCKTSNTTKQTSIPASGERFHWTSSLVSKLWRRNTCYGTESVKRHWCRYPLQSWSKKKVGKIERRSRTMPTAFRQIPCFCPSLTCA